MIAEEVLEILSNNLYESKIIHEYKDGKFDYRKIVEWFLSQTPIMETYASEREAKYKELWEAQRQALSILDELTTFHDCQVNGVDWNRLYDDATKLRQKIVELEQELGLTPAKV